MKTITFYSYKGGVGRSLALSNIAKRLSELKKKVCIIDFDLDAPGLQFKFSEGYLPAQIKKGLVDYIHEFSNTGGVPQKISDYVTLLQSDNISCSNIELIAAGNIEDNSYWKKLSMISWADMFYSDNGYGLNFFLNLKHKIQTELEPDFLLIDSRTGITDISGITLKLMADEVVILGVNNDENIFGSKMIIKTLLDKENALFGVTPKINFVLTRIPFTDSPEDKAKKLQILERLTEEFKEFLQIPDFQINLIHSDRRLEEQERQLIGYSIEPKTVSISNDYLKLFDLLTAGHLSERELKRLSQIKRAEREYTKYASEVQLYKKLEHLNNAIQLDPENILYVFVRAELYHKMENREAALEGYSEILKLVDPESGIAMMIYQNMAVILGETGRYQEALRLVEKQVDQSTGLVPVRALRVKSWVLNKLNRNDEARQIWEHLIDELQLPDDITLNFLANYWRINEDYKKAYQYIQKAIEIDPEQPTYFATLAEINEAEGNFNNFLINFRLALEKGLTVKNLADVTDIYLKYEHNEQMIALVNEFGFEFELIRDLGEKFKQGLLNVDKP